jgi:hypothetical protein
VTEPTGNNRQVNAWPRPTARRPRNRSQINHDESLLATPGGPE